MSLLSGSVVLAMLLCKWCIVDAQDALDLNENCIFHFLHIQFHAMDNQHFTNHHHINNLLYYYMYCLLLDLVHSLYPIHVWEVVHLPQLLHSQTHVMFLLLVHANVFVESSYLPLHQIELAHLLQH